MLNNVAIRSVLDRGNTHEINLADEMLKVVSTNDLLICDRAYLSYKFLSSLIKRKIAYVIRCPRSSFNEVNAMFEEKSPSSVEVTIRAQRKVKQENSGITLRLVKVVLPSGEFEVLATSLMDEQKFKTGGFKELYFLRWGVETFFAKLKGRLSLENFTGKSVESVKQDFWSAIFISNLESIMTEDVEEALNMGLTDDKLKKSINKSVSFNAIKNLAFDIFATESDTDCIMDQLSKLFLMNTLVVRKGRKIDRHKVPYLRLFNYQKRVRKHIF